MTFNRAKTEPLCLPRPSPTLAMAEPLWLSSCHLKPLSLLPKTLYLLQARNSELFNLFTTRNECHWLHPRRHHHSPLSLSLPLLFFLVLLLLPWQQRTIPRFLLFPSLSSSVGGRITTAGCDIFASLPILATSIRPLPWPPLFPFFGSLKSWKVLFELSIRRKKESWERRKEKKEK